MHVAVDFDGVIHEYKGRTGVIPKGILLPEGIVLLNALREAGHKVDIFTTRPSFFVWQWLEENGILDLVNDVTNVKKASYSAFIDDRAVRFEGSTADVLRDIERIDRQELPWWKKQE